MFKKFFLLVGFIFILSFIWEVAHTPLYGTEMHHFGIDFDLPLTLSSLPHYFLMWLVASAGDVFYILIILSIPILWRRKVFWFDKAGSIDFLAVIIFGVAVASAIELSALFDQRWGYNSFMPIVPFLEVGLTPFIQLAISSLVSIYAGKKLIFRENVMK